MAKTRKSMLNKRNRTKRRKHSMGQSSSRFERRSETKEQNRRTDNDKEKKTNGFSSRIFRQKSKQESRQFIKKKSFVKKMKSLLRKKPPTRPASRSKIRMCKTEQEMRDVAAKICRNYLSGAWKTVKAEELIFKRISGGLSNFLYLVGLPERKNSSSSLFLRQRTFSETYAEPSKVLLRIYGQVHGERSYDAIITETVIFTLLSERNLGPKLYGVFSGGRIEEYIPARSLLVRELADPALSMKIAEKMAAIHLMEVPLSKEPTWLWKTMQRWIRTAALHLKEPGPVIKEESDVIEKLRGVDFEKEFDWLKAYLTEIDSPVVFCHNDLQEGNILLLEDVPSEACLDDVTAGTEGLPVPRSRSASFSGSEEELPRLSSERSSLLASSLIQLNSQANENIAGKVDISKLTQHDPVVAATTRADLRHAAKKDRFSDKDGARKKQTAVQFEDTKANKCTKLDIIQLGAKNKNHNFAYEDANTSDSIHSHTSEIGEPKLVLIDFEYCAYNYRAFDVANHFQEWSYDYTNPEYPFFYDHPQHLPTFEQKEIFIREYLKQHQRMQSEDAALEPEPAIEETNRLLGEVEEFSLAVNLFWCLWAIVNAGVSKIPFGYWIYAGSKYDRYLVQKQRTIKNTPGGGHKRKICEVDI